MSQPVPILLLEDSEIDIEIVKRTFKKSKIDNPFYAVKDGVEALKILNGEGEDQISQPCVILIDINMPRMDGLSFLEKVRDNEDLSKNVAFILTTSSRPEDMERAYRLNAAGYIIKDDIKHLGDMLGGYLNINRFPVEDTSFSPFSY